MRLSEEDRKWVRHLFWMAQELMLTLPRADKDTDEPELWEGAVEEMTGVLLVAPDWARICPQCNGKGWVNREVRIAGDYVKGVEDCDICQGRPL